MKGYFSHRALTSTSATLRPYLGGSFVPLLGQLSGSCLGHGSPDILRHASSIESHRAAGLSPDSRSVATENYGLRGEQRVTRAMRVPITAWVSVNGSCTRFPAFGAIPPKNLKSFCNRSRLHSWLAAVDEDGHYVFAMPLYAAGRQALHW